MWFEKSQSYVEADNDIPCLILAMSRWKKIIIAHMEKRGYFANQQIQKKGEYAIPNAGAIFDLNRGTLISRRWLSQDKASIFKQHQVNTTLQHMKFYMGHIR